MSEVGPEIRYEGFSDSNPQSHITNNGLREGGAQLSHAQIEISTKSRITSAEGTQTNRLPRDLKIRIFLKPEASYPGMLATESWSAGYPCHWGCLLWEYILSLRLGKLYGLEGIQGCGRYMMLSHPYLWITARITRLIPPKPSVSITQHCYFKA